jgi:SAM-dependent methyltransferase
MHRWVRKALCGVNQTVGRWLPAGALSRTVPGIPGPVHVDDQMYRSDAPEHVRHYVEDARSAVENIEQSLGAVGRSFDDVRSCLDFACGYGRVTRWLVRALGPERVIAADLDRQAIRFCSHAFGTSTVRSPCDPARVAIRDSYDVVFVGSLLTHLPVSGCAAALRALRGIVRPDGLLIFSTQGESCLAHLDWYGPEFVAAADEFRTGVRRDGAAFVPYRGRRDYGITILTPARWRRWSSRMRSRRSGSSASWSEAGTATRTSGRISAQQNRPSLGCVRVRPGLSRPLLRPALCALEAIDLEAQVGQIALDDLELGQETVQVGARREVQQREHRLHVAIDRALGLEPALERAGECLGDQRPLEQLLGQPRHLLAAQHVPPPGNCMRRGV